MDGAETQQQACITHDNECSSAKHGILTPSASLLISPLSCALKAAPGKEGMALFRTLAPTKYLYLSDVMQTQSYPAHSVATTCPLG